MKGEQDSVGRVLAEWARVRPDLDVSPVGVIARMARIRYLVDAEQARLFATRSITPADFPVLVTLRRRTPPFRLTHSQLAADLGLTAGTVTTRVDRLEGLGLVRRRVDAADSRVRWVELTTDGLEVVDDLIPRHLALEEDLLSALSGAQRARLSKDLAVLLGDLESRG